MWLANDIIHQRDQYCYITARHGCERHTAPNGLRLHTVQRATYLFKCEKKHTSQISCRLQDFASSSEVMKKMTTNMYKVEMR